MTDRRAELGQLLQRLRGRISPALPREEVANGWSPELVTSLLDWMDELGRQLAGADPGALRPRSDLARTLNHWGVLKGEALELAATIDARWTELIGPADAAELAARIDNLLNERTLSGERRP